MSTRQKAFRTLCVIIIGALPWLMMGCDAVGPPDRPKGSSSGVVGQQLTYGTKGTDPLNAHEYRFDWGDGSISSWKDKAKRSHAYAGPGTYSIRAQERCPLGLFTTDWSSAKKVTISRN